MTVSIFFEHVLDLLFPPRCPFCRALLQDYEKNLCRKCSSTLPSVPEAADSQSLRHIERCVSPLYYTGKVRESLLRYKFGGLRIYAKTYAVLMAERLEKRELSFYVITWVPLSAKRLRSRGYDQAKLLAVEIAKRCGAPCECLLIKATDTPPQSGTHSRRERESNIKGVYRPTALPLIRDRNILIVDDIVTTGSTLGECARVLKAAGAKSVSAVTVARSAN